MNKNTCLRINVMGGGGRLTKNDAQFQYNFHDYSRDSLSILRLSSSKPIILPHFPAGLFLFPFSEMPMLVHCHLSIVMKGYFRQQLRKNNSVRPVSLILQRHQPLGLEYYNRRNKIFRETWKPKISSKGV